MSNTTFSYAQAAKGHTAVQPTQSASSPAPPSTSSQGKDDATTATTTSVTAPSVTSNDSEVRDAGQHAQLDREIAAKHDLEATPAGEAAHAPLNSSAEQAPQPVRNGDSGSVDLSRSQPRSASQTSRSVDGADSKKSRKPRRAKGSDKDGDEQEEEKEPEPVKPVLLAEAPPPTINVWQKRIEEAAAKAKASPTANNPTRSAAAVLAAEEPKRRPAVETAGPPPASTSEVNNSEKPQRRPVEITRPADQPPRRSAPRGSRAAESLPSVADASSWPDPKSAATSEEGKRRAQDKTEKESQEEAAPIKRTKEKWVPVPYVPTVNFQTHIPQKTPKPRGGARGGRDIGTRGAHSAAAASGSTTTATPVAEKTPAPAGVPASKETRPRDGSNATRPTSLPPSASKRTSTDSGFARDARKPPAAAGAERSKDTAATNASASGSAKGESARPSRPEFAHANNEQQPHYPARTGFSDRRAESSGPKAFDNSFKEGGYSGPKDQSYPVRERGEGRGDRGGRGGFRGRGGHNNGSISSHSQMSGFPPTTQYAVQLPGGQHPPPYSPPAHQSAYGSSFGTGSTRGGGRGRANPTSNSYPRTTSNGAGPASKMQPVNTSIAGFDYHVQQQFSAYPYQTPFYDPSTIQLLMLQVEYYLSVDNLCKDFFIRKRMDSKGFVPLSVIANFNRMRDLAPDNDAIRFACEQSDKIDYVVGDDNIERLRLREKWDRFVLGHEEREEEARTDGPNHWVWRSRHSRSPYAGPPMMMPGYPAPSPTMFPGNFPPEDSYPPHYTNGAHYDPGVNGGARANGHRFGVDSQLSAAVPEFSPSTPAPFTLESINAFSDQQVEDLKVLVGFSGKKGTSHLDTPIANGSSVAPPNGDAAAARSGSASGAVKSDNPRSPTSSNPNVIWAKQQKGDASEQLEEPYPLFRKKALEQRRDSKPGETPRAMKNLYEFWSHFLVGRFNAKMYEEFRAHAMDDANKDIPTKDGLRCLVHYYSQLFAPDTPKPWGGSRHIPEIFNLHSREAYILQPPPHTNGDTGM